VKGSQPWIHSAAVDSLYLLAPAFISVAFVIFFPGATRGEEIALWAWVVFVLSIDVAHVYGTLFRTYLSREERARRGPALIFVPLLAWGVGVALHSVDPLLFWRALAYVAVFHFVRQQYGFLRLYTRGERSRWRRLDEALLYLAAGWPVLYWHAHLPRQFHWFVEGDFVAGLPVFVERLALVAYGALAIGYLIKEGDRFRRERTVNVPKQLILVGTGLSWYVGIVALDGDLPFTVTNVVSHGVPYLGLIWIYGRKKARITPEEPVVARLRLKHFFTAAGIPLFVGALLFLAFVEEGLWDGLVWRDHPTVFSFFSWLPQVHDSKTLAWLVPLLSLPQVTHYVLDGFIWQLREKDTEWQGVIFPDGVTA
jgi:hypothetical protein